ncbi:DUF1934 family protein [Bacillus sp. REN10]|uniref:DUF1934 domain-containing protein n=1 Tax=Bacillus sp. REN10 TaxID=2782541 RepID=UPI00193BB8DE|nr:DUF1934 family protein [Bacillus sp. REN10]
MNQQAHIPVNICLNTSIEIDGEQETYELTLSGEFHEKSNGFFLKYDEVQEEGTVHTVVKFSDNEALILRSGAVKMRLPFSLNEQRNGSHDSPYGTLLLNTQTKTLTHNCTYTQQTVQGTLALSYNLLMQGSPVGQYKMNITFQGV